MILNALDFCSMKEKFRVFYSMIIDKTLALMKTLIENYSKSALTTYDVVNSMPFLMETFSNSILLLYVVLIEA